MVGDGVLFDPDTNYEHFSVWWAGAYFQPEGNKIGEAMIFLKKDPAYPYKYFSRFVIQSGYQSACYVDVYGVPLPLTRRQSRGTICPRSAQSSAVI